MIPIRQRSSQTAKENAQRSDIFGYWRKNDRQSPCVNWILWDKAPVMVRNWRVIPFAYLSFLSRTHIVFLMSKQITDLDGTNVRPPLKPVALSREGIILLPNNFEDLVIRNHIMKLMTYSNVHANIYSARWYRSQIATFPVFLVTNTMPTSLNLGTFCRLII